MKKVIILLAFVLAVLVVFIILKNINKPVEPAKIQPQTISGVEIKNANLIYDGNISKFTAMITNKTDNSIQVDTIDIKFIDKNGIEIVTLKGLVDGTLQPDQSKLIDASMNIDITNYETIEYKF